jgi:proline iminopeptidase
MVEIDGLYFEEFGAGTPALVLHGGLGLDLHPYRSLDPLAGDLRLIYIDHRGNGRSTRPDPATMTMVSWADDAAAAGRSLAGDEPIVVIGHSYGGFIAQEMAIRHADIVRALVLVCTTPGQLGTGEKPAVEGPALPQEFAEMLSSMPQTDGALASSMEALAPAYLHRAEPDRLRSLMSDTVFSASAMRRGFEVLAEWSSVDRLGSIAAPTLVVAGRHDPFTAWPQAERIARRIPDADVVVFEHSSHFPWLDEPEQFFTTVTEWLRQRGVIESQ